MLSAETPGQAATNLPVPASAAELDRVRDPGEPVAQTGPTGEVLRFDIHASVVFQLGENLITDVVQALVELIKNSYDADATYCSVVIDTQGHPGPTSVFPQANGLITIEDDGSGMDLPTIRRGWLTISNSEKRDIKRHQQTTVRGRTPLGDKGLGRLGVQRLGDNLELFTRPANSTVEYEVSFSWRDFLSEASLSQVPIRFEALPAKDGRSGTKLLISDLRNSSDWTAAGAVDDLQTRLSQMISPYRQVRDFVVAVTLNGQALELAEITEQVRQAAQVRYAFRFDGEVFHIRGKVKLDFFRPQRRDEQDLFRRLVEWDNGEELVVFLSQQKQSRDLCLKRAEETDWFLEFSHKSMLGDVNPLAMAGTQPANPGPFYGEIDSFDLGDGSDERPSVLDRKSSFRAYVKALSGVRVYRDGFGIRVDRDWLGLGKQWTSATSYYGLKPQNTMGYVALSAKDNDQLQETTDREGFRDTPHYQNFSRLLQLFVHFTLRAQGALRRGYNEFAKSERARAAGVQDSTSSEELLNDLSSGLSAADGSRNALIAAGAQLDRALEHAHVTVRRVEAAVPKNSPDAQALQDAAERLERAVSSARPVLTGVQSVLENLSALQGKVKVLVDRDTVQREQLLQMYEMIGVGLTAEALSHEIRNVTDRLAHRSQSFRQYLRSKPDMDRQVLAYLEHMQSSVAALRRQLAHLEPSLRYVRERREKVELGSFLDETLEFYRTRMSDVPIELSVQQTSLEDFTLLINRGKLVQVIDNLVLNSEYWLREDLRTGRIAKGVITIEGVKPYLRISDNGRGVDPSVEASLFEPFVTTKGRGEGRGLGLFVVRQLLDAEGCFIDILPRRNSNGRLYIFQLDFTGAVDGRRAS